MTNHSQLSCLFAPSKPCRITLSPPKTLYEDRVIVICDWSDEALVEDLLRPYGVWLPLQSKLLG